MSGPPAKALVDANVWVDYFLDRDRGAHEAAVSFMLEAAASGCALYTSSASLADLYFVLGQEMRRLVRACGDSAVSPASIRESSWASLRCVLELSMAVPVAQGEALRAFTYRPLHDDFEDGLVIAAAQRVDADYVVTSDRALIRHAPVSCLEPSDMAVLLRTLRENDGG